MMRESIPELAPTAGAEAARLSAVFNLRPAADGASREDRAR